jgi:hypothetical protein
MTMTAEDSTNIDKNDDKNEMDNDGALSKGRQPVGGLET